MNNPIPKKVKQIYDTYPKEVRHKLLFIRRLIFDIAASNKNIGGLEEGIKWGEPSYITNQTRSGSTIRLGWKSSIPNRCCIYFNCKTTLVDNFKEIFGNKFKYEGNRCIWFEINDDIPIKELSICLSMALMYPLDKKKR